MHASDDHEGVGRIPVRAEKVVKAVRKKKKTVNGESRYIYVNIIMLIQII